MTLPILTFEQGALSPSLGYVFDAQWVEPYESIVGILWKFARVNALPGHVLVPQIGATPTDPYVGLAANPAEIPVQRLARQLGVPHKMIRAALTPASGKPALSPVFRYCRRCLSFGYHGIVHQRLSVQQCPIHGDWLKEVCPTCDERMDFKINTLIMDAPFRCGYCARRLGTWNWRSHKPLSRINRIAVTRAFIHNHRRRTVHRAKKYHWRSMQS